MKLPGTFASGVRTVALVAVGVLIGGLFMIAPVSGHVGGSVSHLWSGHIRPRADDRYLLNNGFLPIHHIGSGAERNGPTTEPITETLETWCPDGEVAVGGGVDAITVGSATFTHGPYVVESNYIERASGGGWRGTVEATSSDGFFDIEVDAWCMRAPGF